MLWNNWKIFSEKNFMFKNLIILSLTLSPSLTSNRVLASKLIFLFFFIVVDIFSPHRLKKKKKKKKGIINFFALNERVYV